MKIFAPDYFGEFACIKGDCRHSCCAGWEIDIDEESREFYRSIGGEIGKRLAENIVDGPDGAHFKLGPGERCPFLNADGLCDMIIALGEDSLCQICDDHPRFRNFFSHRTEIGLGLCCEAAGRLILERKTPFAICEIGDGGEEQATDITVEEAIIKAEETGIAVEEPDVAVEEPDVAVEEPDVAAESTDVADEETANVAEVAQNSVEKTAIAAEEFYVVDEDADEEFLLELRDSMLAAVYEKNTSPDDMTESVLECAGSAMPDMAPDEWADFLSGLEMLDAGWKDMLNSLRCEAKNPGPEFDEAYRQLMAYLIYRHMPGAMDDGDVEGRAAFVCVMWRIIRAIHGGMGGGMDALIEICRMYSSEIEYSDENIAAILDKIEERL